MLAQKQAQFQQEIASGKITERTAAARRREIQTIKDTITAKQREEKIEDYIQSILTKKIAGGKAVAEDIARRLKTEKDELKTLEDQLKITKNLTHLIN
jgi:rubrerythrin